MPFQRNSGRKWHIPMASNRKISRRWIWLTKWDKVKAHDTLMDWYTGREWPLNCMTVISAWWRSNMSFQRLSGRLNYYITRWNRKSVNWRSDELEIRWFRDKMWYRKPAESWAPGPPVEHQKNENDTRLCEVNMLQSFFSLQLPLTRKRCNKVRGTYFSKEVFARLYSLRRYVSCMYICICIYMYDVFV